MREGAGGREGGRDSEVVREVGREQQLGSGSQWKLVSGGAGTGKSWSCEKEKKPHVTPIKAVYLVL